MLTSDQIRLVAHATALRFDETDVDLWFAPADDLLPEVHSLVVNGYLDGVGTVTTSCIA